MKRNTHNGYTLIELLVTISIVSVMASFAIPTVSDVIRTNQLRTSADNIYAIIRFSRSEAARQGKTIQVGALNGKDWGSGVVAWVEGDNVEGFDGVKDTEIRRTSINGKVTVLEASNAKIIPFNGQGYTSAAVTLSICDGRSNESGRSINILPSGFSVMHAKGDCG